VCVGRVRPWWQTAQKPRGKENLKLRATSIVVLQGTALAVFAGPAHDLLPPASAKYAHAPRATVRNADALFALRRSGMFQAKRIAASVAVNRASETMTAQTV